MLGRQLGLLAALFTCTITVAGGTTLAAQSIRLGTPVDPQARDAVLVLRLYTVASGQGWGTVPREVTLEAKRALDGLADMAMIGIAGGTSGVEIPGGGRLTAVEATFNVLDVLNVPPWLGRGFEEGDTRRPERAAMLTAATWQERFNRDPGVIGRRFTHVSPSGVSTIVIVVGILPPGLFTAHPEVDPGTQILLLTPDRLDETSALGPTYSPILRLRPGVRAGQVDAALRLTMARLHANGTSAGQALRLESLREPRR
jgi:hypothetical protein